MQILIDTKSDKKKTFVIPFDFKSKELRNPDKKKQLRILKSQVGP